MKHTGPDLIMRFFLWLYSALWMLLLPVILLYLRRRGKKDADYVKHLPERFGTYRGARRADIWIHAVSLGEMRSAVPLVRALLARGETVVCTHFTPAGRREALRVFAPEIAEGRVQSRWVPFEFAWVWRRFFRQFQPRAGLVMEIEIWPRMIFAARAADVPLFMCNAQYPSRSMERDAKWVGLGLRHRMMRGFAGAFVKSQLQARRFASVGVANIKVTGELRFDQPIPEDHVLKGRAARKLWATDRRVIAFASVIEGEDAVYIRALRALYDAAPYCAPMIVYIPRAPERFAESDRLLTEAGFCTAKRSTALSGDLEPTAIDQPEVLLGDSLGEMYFYLSMADLVVTGGGFHRKGAHNIIEPLALKKPVIVGPYIHTIEYPCAEAVEAGVCLRLASEADLLPALRDWAGPGDARIATFFNDHAGATERTLRALDLMISGQP